jgi:hypothetical protein
MQDYERMINYFFHHLNATVTSPYTEKKNYRTDDDFSISYILKKHPVENHDLGLVRFDVEEYENKMIVHVSYSYDTSGKFGLDFDKGQLKDMLDIGIKCLSYLDNKKTRRYCPVIHIIMSMDIKTKKISIENCFQTLNILSNYSTITVFLEEHVTKLVDTEFRRLNEDITNVSLIDKLDLLAMESI